VFRTAVFGTAVSTARSQRRAVTRTTAALLAAATLTLAGCGAGQYAQSVNEQAAVLGANGEVGNMSALNVRLARPDAEKYPAGSNPRVLLYLSNDGINPDTLTSVSSSAAQSVQITGDPVIPAQTLLDLSGDSGRQVTVQGLTQDLYSGVSIPMTFSFANAGSFTINVPIENPPERSERELIEILPPHPTAIWEEEGSKAGGEQAGASAEESGSASGTSTAPSDANQGGNVEGAPSSTAGTAVSGG
jgi:copper(I)-binding protein